MKLDCYCWGIVYEIVHFGVLSGEQSATHGHRERTDDTVDWYR